MIGISKKYPQNIWANEIASLIRSGKISCDKDAVFADSPCGNGIIGNLVFNACRDLKIKMRISDINTDLKVSPFASINDPDFSVLTENIFEQKLDGNRNVWLFVNSLYCLPDADKLLEHQKQNYETVIGVFPDITCSNYEYFMARNPDFKNPSAMDIDATVRLFESHGYTKRLQKRNTRIPFHKWNRIFGMLKLNLSLRNILFTIFDRLLFFLPGQYAIIVFSRNEQGTSDL